MVKEGAQPNSGLLEWYWANDQLGYMTGYIKGAKTIDDRAQFINYAFGINGAMARIALAYAHKHTYEDDQLAQQLARLGFKDLSSITNRIVEKAVVNSKAIYLGDETLDFSCVVVAPKRVDRKARRPISDFAVTTAQAAAIRDNFPLFFMEAFQKAKLDLQYNLLSTATHLEFGVEIQEVRHQGTHVPFIGLQLRDWYIAGVGAKIGANEIEPGSFATFFHRTRFAASQSDFDRIQDYIAAQNAAWARGINLPIQIWEGGSFELGKRS